MSRRRNKAFRIALAVSDARRGEEIILRRNRFADEDRRFAEAIARCRASELRTLEWISGFSPEGGACLTSGPVSGAVTAKPAGAQGGDA